MISLWRQPQKTSLSLLIPGMKLFDFCFKFFGTNSAKKVIRFLFCIWTDSMKYDGSQNYIRSKFFSIKFGEIFERIFFRSVSCAAGSLLLRNNRLFLGSLVSFGVGWGCYIPDLWEIFFRRVYSLFDFRLFSNFLLFHLLQRHLTRHIKRAHRLTERP